MPATVHVENVSPGFRRDKKTQVSYIRYKKPLLLCDRPNCSIFEFYIYIYMKLIDPCRQCPARILKFLQAGMKL